ncbi:MAG: tRNA (guanosine(46)-N7)-methyltransferase TrmB [Pedobacter sp.]|nr:MAG: tRNA (guanosine(46)-N7)-methyltransferase TrmB [Pedobacter sp.]
MGKDKLRKFSEINEFSNVYQLEEGYANKGKWAQAHFKNENPLVLELACGKGEYALGMARIYPDKNYMGLDLKGNRIWRGAKSGMEENITNLAFLRIQIEDILDYFGPAEVAEIWITFADPQPRESREKKRLTSSIFIEKYRQILKPGGKINLKTDNDMLYHYTLDKIAELNLVLHKSTADLYQSDLVDDVLSIKTHYENIYLKKQKNINYVQFSLS